MSKSTISFTNKASKSQLKLVCGFLFFAVSALMGSFLFLLVFRMQFICSEYLRLRMHRQSAWSAFQTRCSKVFKLKYPFKLQDRFQPDLIIGCDNRENSFGKKWGWDEWRMVPTNVTVPLCQELLARVGRMTLVRWYTVLYTHTSDVYLSVHYRWTISSSSPPPP